MELTVNITEEKIRKAMTDVLEKYGVEVDDKPFGTIAEIIAKQDKFRWHDLRKNPYDLPEENENGESEYVLCLVGKSSWNHWEQAYFNHNENLWSIYCDNVIAWKYIEPFEEDEG